MAAGKFTVIDVALEKIGSGTIDLSSGSFVVVLTTSAQPLDAAFSGVGGQALYTDLTAELAGPGYTPGGEPLTGADWSRLSSVVTFKANPTPWTALTGTVKYAVVIQMGVTDPEHILGFADLETSLPDGLVISSADFIINWSGALFNLARI